MSAEPGSATWYFKRDRLAVFSLLLLALLILLAIFAPQITAYPEQGMGSPSIMDKLKPPSLEHPMGTDPLGRDVLARVLFGARSAQH